MSPPANPEQVLPADKDTPMPSWAQVNRWLMVERCSEAPKHSAGHSHRA
jgi:hypothetical protein